jgi:hypothetical protein
MVAAGEPQMIASAPRLSCGPPMTAAGIIFCRGDRRIFTCSNSRCGQAGPASAHRKPRRVAGRRAPGAQGAAGRRRGAGGGRRAAGPRAMDRNWAASYLGTSCGRLANLGEREEQARERGTSGLAPFVFSGEFFVRFRVIVEGIDTVVVSAIHDRPARLSMCAAGLPVLHCPRCCVLCRTMLAAARCPILRGVLALCATLVICVAAYSSG